MMTWIELISTYVVVQNFAYAALQVWMLQRRPNYSKALCVVIFLWAAGMGALFVAEACGPSSWKPFLRDYLYLPMAIEMVWNVLFLQLLVPGMIVAALIIRRGSRVPLTQQQAPENISRRRFFYLLGYGAVPALATGMGVHGALSKDDLRRRDFAIPIAGLPAEMEGFTIAHISDLHSGLFVGPERLRLMSDLANDLKADLVVVTGDIINREMDEFPVALEALRRVESRLGIYLCEGNHDVIPGEGLVVRACRENGLRILFNQTAIIPIGGHRLILGGLPWLSPHPGTPPEMVRALYPERQPGDVRVLLAHHPHFFDIADDVDLLLSGHTHGGQIMFGDVGLGNLRFKYNSGRFHRDHLTMIVNNGCGDWFPCRIGAPAEIGLLRLTGQPVTG